MTPLVLVHGFLGGAAQWDGLDLPGAIAPDLPGFGRNAHMAPLPSIEAMADWVIGQIDAPRYDLVGHSMGGMIVQEIARRDAARLRRLVLYATGSVGLLPGRFEPIAESKRRAEAEGARVTARRIAATWFDQREAASGYEPCAAIAEQAGLAAIHAGLDAMAGWSGQAQLAAIPHPTLILWGDRDRTYPWAQIETLWRGVPDARLAMVPGAAHAVHLEKPGLFLPPLLDFLG